MAATSTTSTLVDTNTNELIPAPGATNRLLIIAVSGTNLSNSSPSFLRTFDDDQDYEQFNLADTGGGFAFCPAEGYLLGVNQAYQAALDNTTDPNVVLRTLYRVVGASG
ncbi:MAG TPA: hypothetical protein VHK68_00770 [Gemmatimonadales bacterium]|jgi:hypothetical protein|nr:hypothetical protein [Gemmatimonadales bacterium]